MDKFGYWCLLVFCCLTTGYCVRHINPSVIYSIEVTKHTYHSNAYKSGYTCTMGVGSEWERYTSEIVCKRNGVVVPYIENDELKR